ncbi:MAG: hypothetical protein C0523_01575 [Cytophaga sp.]|nr:hypothetical protein [Cytophaga sp.]
MAMANEVKNRYRNDLFTFYTKTVAEPSNGSAWVNWLIKYMELISTVKAELYILNPSPVIGVEMRSSCLAKYPLRFGKLGL